MSCRIWKKAKKKEASPGPEPGYLRVMILDAIHSATQYANLHIITSTNYNDQDLKVESMVLIVIIIIIIFIILLEQSVETILIERLNCALICQFHTLKKHVRSANFYLPGCCCQNHL